jgi:predicted porin
VLLLLATSAHAASALSFLQPEEQPATQAATPPDHSAIVDLSHSAQTWSARVDIVAWAPALNGKWTLGGLGAAESFDIDIINASDVRITPAIEGVLQYDHWAFSVSGFVFGIDSDSRADEAFTAGGVAVAAGTDVSYEVDFAMIGATVGYRAYTLPIKGEGGRTIASPLDVRPSETAVWLDVYGALRAYDLSLDAQVVGGATLADESHTWVDPSVGMRLTFDLPEGFMVDLGADLGGGSILGGSDLNWQVNVGMGYQFHPNASAHIGFRHMTTNFEDGDFTFDSTIAGLYAGLTIHF